MDEERFVVEKACSELESDFVEQRAV